MMGSTLVRRHLCVLARRPGTSQTWIGRENFELKYAVLKMISFAPTPWNEMDLNMLTVTSNVVWPVSSRAM